MTCYKRLLQCICWCVLALQLQELEMENAKLKTDLGALRRVTAEGETGGQELLSKWSGFVLLSEWSAFVLLLTAWTFPFTFSLPLFL